MQPKWYAVYNDESQNKDCLVEHLEDGRLRVRVDGHDALGVLHARQMLNRARNSNRYVQLWCHHLSRLAHLSPNTLLSAKPRYHS